MVRLVFVSLGQLVSIHTLKMMVQILVLAPSVSHRLYWPVDIIVRPIWLTAFLYDLDLAKSKDNYLPILLL